ncbi:M56 family metallopeptidase, partial [Neolewinella persica]|uniref:M56 family metallopeptidase n=1 Tax=Neolewinella persica TaxID=70998 RepID=UPI000367A3EF
FFLLGGWLFGLLVPLLPGLEGEVSLPVANLPKISFSGPAAAAMTVEIVAESTWSFTDFLPWLYLFGVLIFGARPLVQGWLTEQYLRTGRRSTFSGYPVIRHARIRSPFAARGYVFLPAGMTDASLENTALLHETAHLRARHHYDKFLLTLGSILLWFHPLTWAYRRLLATVHEYEADAAVLERVPARTYGLQLLHCSLGPTGGLGLFSSPLKQRIEMIANKTRERKLRFLPLLSLCVLVTGLLLFCSDVKAQDLPAAENSIAEKDQPRPYDPTKGDAYLVTEPDPTLLSEETLQGLIKDIQQNITYPKAARETGLTGRLRIVSLMDESGKILFSSHEKSSKKAPIAEIVVVGKGKAKGSSEAGDTMFLDAVGGVMVQKQLTVPSTAEGKPAVVIFALEFVFKLEE